MRRVELANEHCIYILDDAALSPNECYPTQGDYAIDAAGAMYIYDKAGWRKRLSIDPVLSLATRRIDLVALILQRLMRALK